MKLGFLFLTVALGAGIPAAAQACSRGSAEASAAAELAYLTEVTAVYRAVAEDFSPLDPSYPSDDFTVRLRPVEAVWGDLPAEPIALEYTAGACTEWHLWGLGNDGESIEGRRYLVFSGPQSERDRSYLKIVPDDAELGPSMLSLWREIRSQNSARAEIH